MKWLIISCALIFYSVSLTSAESEEKHDQDTKCFQEIKNQSQAHTKCVKKHFDLDEFYSELHVTYIGASSQDPNAVRTFGEKYCPKVNHSVYCFPIAYDVSVECLDTIGGKSMVEEIIFQTEMLAKILVYACKNDSSVLFRVDVNGELDMIDLKKNAKCVELNNVPLADQNSVNLRVNPLHCDDVVKSVNCYLNYLRDQGNQKLTQITNEVNVLVRAMMKC